MRIVEDARARIRKELPTLRKEIDEIIRKEWKSLSLPERGRIEALIETLDHHTYWGIEGAEEQFNRLNDYYALFNQEIAEEYREQRKINGISDL